MEALEKGEHDDKNASSVEKEREEVKTESAGRRATPRALPAANLALNSLCTVHNKSYCCGKEHVIH
jgi:hypothetical protein